MGGRLVVRDDGAGTELMINMRELQGNSRKKRVESPSQSY